MTALDPDVMLHSYSQRLTEEFHDNDTSGIGGSRFWRPDGESSISD